MLLKVNDTDPGVATDLTPIIDMVFNLLIFFLIATTFQQTERELSIALPTASAALPISVAMREITINVDAQGDIHVGGRVIDGEQLRTIIAEAVKTNPEQKVTVRGDRNTAYANVVRVLDICKTSGVQQPYLDTVMEQ